MNYCKYGVGSFTKNINNLTLFVIVPSEEDDVEFETTKRKRKRRKRKSKDEKSKSGESIEILHEGNTRYLY